MNWIEDQVRIKIMWIFLIGSLLFNFSCERADTIDDQFNYAKERSTDLRLSMYITAHTVQNLLADEAGRREAISIFRCNGITKAYIEVYRAGLVLDQKLLETVRDHFRANDIQVVGGIATVPGKDFGVRQEAQLGWFNWQNQKTQDDLEKVMRMSAAVFDEFIIDDFLCTADTSQESKQARGDRTWSQYRMDLLSGLAEKLFIKPAREVNPDITMIIKYPQWYDRFHLFGYDVVREPAMFDKVWVGTESRGQYTQRYGFVQPYEGFVNYRWLAGLSGGKISGAWFDHGDCDENDFIEQAYQSVLAGAREIVLFNYYNFISAHKGHHFLRRQFHHLADLAKAVAVNPVSGPVGYKPANSDAGGDLYLLDFIGMFGVSLVPASTYPADADVIFLPTQAAADIHILEKVKQSLAAGKRLVFTTGFLATAKDGDKLAALAGIKWPLEISVSNAETILENNISEKIKHGLDLETVPRPNTAQPLLIAKNGRNHVPFFMVNDVNGNKVYTLNSHTFSQADFDRVGEVLLCPKPLGLLEVPQSWANTIRTAFNQPLAIDLNAPARVAFQSIGKSGWVVHNYNQEEVSVDFRVDGLTSQPLINGFSGEKVEVLNGRIHLNLAARSRIWIRVGQ